MSVANKFEGLNVEHDEEEEEKEEDSSCSTASDEVEPGEGEHRLQYRYTFWFSRKTPGKQVASYNESLKKVQTIASVEQFWHLYSYLARSNDLQGPCDYLMFRQGIRPMWEDEANRHGGKWIIRLKKGLASRCFENIILAMLGEQFMVGDEVCGAVISVRYQEDILSLWNKTATDEVTTKRIRDTLKRVLNLPANTIIEYKRHTDSLRDKSSYRNTNMYMK